MSENTNDQRIARDLAEHGLRATRQRVAGLRLLRRLNGHPTAAELYERLRVEVAGLSQKTVYDILEALVKAGLVARVTAIGEPYRYEARREPHDHAACRVCGRLYDVPATGSPPARRRRGLPAGFRVETVAVTILGTCGRCRRRS